MGWASKEKQREYNRRYRETHKEQLKEKGRLYQLKNRAKLLPYWRNWYHTHKDTIVPYSKKRRALLRYLALEKLGLKCAKCGFDDLRALQINHKNGGGTKEYKSLSMYRAIIAGTRAIEDLETRCANCNALYEYERGRIIVAIQFAGIKQFLIDNPQMRDKTVKKIREDVLQYERKHGRTQLIRREVA